MIRYNKWEVVSGLVFPKEITWYKMDKSGLPTEPEKPATKFTLPLLSQGKIGVSFFEKPIK